MTTTPDSSDPARSAHLHNAISRPIGEQVLGHPVAPATWLALICDGRGVSIAVDADAWTVTHAGRVVTGRTAVPSGAPPHALEAMLAVAVVGLGMLQSEDVLADGTRADDAIDTLADDVMRDLDARDPAILSNVYPLAFSALQDALAA